MTLDPVNIIVWIIIGAIAGWLASIVMKTNASQGLLTDIIVGIVGGLIGGFVLNAIGVGGEVTGLNLGSILVAFIGAVILLALLRMLRRA
ncbi:MAG: GlsB/YeaQ/YmgE family stress response membrane protein [Anaerolineae bacterium]|nr:GlsB/YeaQ/YmgE family stress response membrane protein [Anaerolineae bacterium]